MSFNCMTLYHYFLIEKIQQFYVLQFRRIIIQINCDIDKLYPVKYYRRGVDDLKAFKADIGNYGRVIRDTATVYYYEL